MISWEHIVELLFKFTIRPQLKDPGVLERFNDVRKRYSDMCALLLDNPEGSKVVSEGYDWSGWAGQVRRSFEKGVPIGFLSHPTLSRTMVFARRRGISATRKKIAYVLEVFGEDVSKVLLVEDYIGLPTISDIRYRTSANRVHHASHLAHYTKSCQRYFWDCDSIVEFGGGYGNMARLIRKMNPKITYTIIDLPELLALQYVYLSSLEGRDSISVIASKGNCKLVTGKVNLFPSHLLLRKTEIESESFLSTWGLTESPRLSQDILRKGGFFGSRHLLIASALNRNNFLKKYVDALSLKKIPVPLGNSVGEGNEYWFK